MNFIKDIENDSLLIIPSNMKSTILNNINELDKFLNVKILSLNELKKELLFDYKEDASLFIMKNYKYKKEVVSDYLNNLYYVEDKDYSNKKLNDLVNMKRLLKDNGYLLHDNYLLDYYKNRNVYVFGYDYIDSFNKKLLDNFSNVNYIDKPLIRDNALVYEFDNLTLEVYYVLDKITSLIDDGTSLEDIVIVNADDNYKKELYKLFNIVGIPIEIYKTTNISSTIMGNKVLELLQEGNSLDETFEYINNNFDLENESNNKLYSKIINIFNRYYPYDYDFEYILESIKYDFVNESVNLNKISGIKIDKINNSYYDDNKHVFFVGFNDGVVPRVIKDESYITDSMKPLVGLDQSYIINGLEKNSLLDNILSIKNIYISYSHRYKDTELFKSSLIDDNKLINSKYTIDDNYMYSEKYTKLLLAKKLDSLIKYGTHDKSLDRLYNTVSIPYKTYDNKFKGIDKNLLKDHLKSKLNLSYTVLDLFYKCKFAYYINNVLRLNPYEDAFMPFLGSLFHEVLSHHKDEDFDLDRIWNDFIKDKELNARDEFYLNKNKKELAIFLDYLKMFNNDTGLDNILTEKNVVIDKSKEYKVSFTGYVDKIMYKEYDGENLVSIIDYKTGAPEYDLSKSEFGLEMQLPVYLYLIDRGHIFEAYKLVGMYLQYILGKEVVIDEDKSYLDQKYANYKLYGYSTSNLKDLSRFDPEYENSKYIYSMKINADGSFNKNSKTFDYDMVNKIINLVDKKIDDMIDNITNGKFDIDPKKFVNEKEIVSCKYCKNRDICFRTFKDIRELVNDNTLSFLDEYK